MDYRTTTRGDRLFGTDGDDTLTATPHDPDLFNGKGGYDTIYANFSKGTDVNLEYNQSFNISSSGVMDGTFYSGHDDDLIFLEVEHIVFTGSTIAEDIYINVRETFNGNAVDWNGGGGDDYLTVDFGGTGSDFLIVGDDGTATSNIGNFENIARYRVNFMDGDDVGIGGVNADFLLGGSGNDSLSGGAGDDTLYADVGEDRLLGGLGVDTLSGGSGADTYKWNRVAESSRKLGNDVVLDFSHAEGDKIDLQEVDAMAGRGKAHFTFIDQAAFTGAGGSDFELRQQVNDDGTVTLFGDTDHNGKANFMIVIHTDAPLVATDLIL